MLVELQARFDEEANIRWARALEEVGAHVVYGLVGLQDPLQGVPRRPPGGRRHPALLPPRHRQLQRPHGRRLRRPRALHRAGSRSARTSPSCSTSSPATRARAASTTSCSRPPSCATGSSTRIRREAEHARAGRPARIIAKMNGLVDRTPDRGAVRGQRRPACAIDLIVRGICCLRPGRARALGAHPRRSRSSTAISSTPASSTSRTAAHPEYLLASADWMPRNLDRRVEIAFPVLDPALQAQIREILETAARRHREGARHPARRQLGPRPGPSMTAAGPLPGAPLRPGRRGRPRPSAGHARQPARRQAMRVDRIVRSLVTRATLCWSPSSPAPFASSDGRCRPAARSRRARPSRPSRCPLGAVVGVERRERLVQDAARSRPARSGGTRNSTSHSCPPARLVPRSATAAPP